MNLGRTIKELRTQKGIRQQALAEDAGITQTYLSLIESNSKEPNLSTLRGISESLKTPLPILFFLSMDQDDIKPGKHEAFEMISPAIKSMIKEFFG